MAEPPSDIYVLRERLGRPWQVSTMLGDDALLVDLHEAERQAIRQFDKGFASQCGGAATHFQFS